MEFVVRNSMGALDQNSMENGGGGAKIARQQRSRRLNI